MAAYSSVESSKAVSYLQALLFTSTGGLLTIATIKADTVLLGLLTDDATIAEIITAREGKEWKTIGTDVVLTSMSKSFQGSTKV